MGLERIASVLQKVNTNYDIDLFKPIIDRIEVEGRYRYRGRMDDELDTAVRVLCDHARAVSFLIADGVIPLNEGRGYVLRRIIRRGVRFGRKLPSEVRLTELVDSVSEAMGDAYSELRERREAIFNLLTNEQDRFAHTMDIGVERVGQIIDQVRARGERTLGGPEVFRLYDTYGIPIDLIAELAEDEGVTIDREGFEEMMTGARAKAKASSKFQAASVAAIPEGVPPNQFVGYDVLDVQSEVKAIVAGSEAVSQLPAGQRAGVVLDPTPFYAESGGQIGDQGELSWPNGRAVVLNTGKAGDWIVSEIEVVEGTLTRGAVVRAIVPRETRLDTTANHTATHLLHKALKDILGPAVQQAGSLVAPDRLRFDYTYHQPLTEEQIRDIEDAVNTKIRENLEVSKNVMPIEEAKATGAVAMFGEKYGDMVRIVSAGDYSREFCGGCHVNRTGDIGVFKIVSDRSLAAGVRRMEALTGRGAIEHIRKLDHTIDDLQQQLQERQKQFDRELKQLRQKLASGGSARDEETPTEVNGIRIITRIVESGVDLRSVADSIRSKLKSGVVVLGSANEGKVTLLTAVTKDLIDRVPANVLIGKLAPIVGGKGGGKADLAQAGGKDADKLDQALGSAEGALREMLAG
jgi:alanyl-tRNA synthetase